MLDTLLGWFAGMLEALVADLPTAALPPGVNAFSVEFGVYLRRADYYVPFLEPLQFMVYAVASTFAGLLAWRVGLFIFNKARGA